MKLATAARPIHDLKNNNRKDVAKVALSFYNGDNKVAKRLPVNISHSHSFEHT